MPHPRWAQTAYDPTETPHLGTEILGRGAQSRKSKTYFDGFEMAGLLSVIRGWPHIMSEVLRRAHELHHGEKLDDQQLRERYTSIVDWEEVHQEFVDHFASVKGFTVKAASRQVDDVDAKSRDTSAGTDARHRNRSNGSGGNERWR